MLNPKTPTHLRQRIQWLSREVLPPLDRLCDREPTPENEERREAVRREVDRLAEEIGRVLG